MTYFNYITRHTKGKPDPTKYDRTLSWSASNGNFGKGAKRLTFTDVAAKHSKLVPAPNFYKPDVKTHVLLGKADKCEGVDYLSDC